MKQLQTHFKDQFAGQLDAKKAAQLRAYAKAGIKPRKPNPVIPERGA